MDLFTSRRQALKVLLVAPEAAPFVKAGGLGEVMFSLPRAISDLGYDARVMIPFYAGIDSQKYKTAVEMEGLKVPTDRESDTEHEFLICNVKKFVSAAKMSQYAEGMPVTTYFLENQEYYEKRSNIYGYADDPIRWALLSRGVLEFLRLTTDWVPDVIIASDWQTGFLVNYLKTTYRKDSRLNKIAAIFAIHNLYYQGVSDHRFVSEMDFDDGASQIPSLFNPRLLKLNMMRRGILYADLISTVSPTYAKEIMTPQYGELLDGLLRERRSRVYGVLNGIDYEALNPRDNVNLKKNYDAGSLDDRVENKEELQGRLGLLQDPDVFVVGIVSRLIEQKGLDLLFSVAEPLLRELKFQLAVLGSGESKYMSFFQELEAKFPGHVAAHLVFDTALPNLFYAGCDTILIPSKFEPSGLTQMEAMRYGAVPIVRKTGGLADAVLDYDPEMNSGTGFVFREFDPMALVIALTRAFEIYRNPAAWRELQKRCMRVDFSWRHSANEYTRLFKIARNFRKRDLDGSR